jgi:hypothetical protein
MNRRFPSAAEPVFIFSIPGLQADRKKAASPHMESDDASSHSERALVQRFVSIGMDMASAIAR